MDTLIAQIREVFKKDEINTEEIREILETYSSNRADWKKYAHFDPHRYTRNLVDAGNGKYNLMILCWAPGLGSNIHDHQNSHCFVKVLDGTLRETRFAWPDEENKEGPMKEISCLDSQINDVTYMSDELGLHRMENPSHVENAISLHLYIPPYSECQTFDQRTGTKSKAVVTFYTKYGRKVDYRGSKEGKLRSSTSKDLGTIRENSNQAVSQATCEPSQVIAKHG
ncbi:Cysteine dioxygenase [Aphelenchoides besseyi]|nr:Cysteine dioxygenase [Aphelenchoides besseyi]KAI6201508.1 Cysteine dioxygenase [Aphelenchoides besseyi]